MTDKTQPEALRLADAIKASGQFTNLHTLDEASAELRRQHARIAELEAELEAMTSRRVLALSAAPAGWKLAPVEPTKEMVAAACREHGYPGGSRAAYVCGYKSMLAASPTPPTEQQAITPETGNSASAQGAAITSESGAVYAELCCDEVSRAVDVVVERCISLTQDATGIKVVYDPIILANALRTELRGFADRTHALRMEQAAPKAAPGDVLDEALRERDDAEDFIDALLDEVLGHERPEWSSSYGRADALNDVQERMTALHKPAVDKAWDRFQSTKAAPGEPLDECFPGESRVAVPQGLISAACFAIRNKRDGGKVLEQLRRYSVGDLSQPLAPQQEAQEPVALLVRKNSWRAGQWEAAPPDSPSYGLTWANQRQYVYATPQPAPDCHHRPPCAECAARARLREKT